LKLVLDTTALIALRKGDESVQRALRERRESADDVGMSRLSEYELRVGAEFLWKKHGDVRESAWLDEVLSWVSIYEDDAEVVREAAKVQAEYMQKGKPVPDMDLLIALSGKDGSELMTLDEGQLAIKDALEAKGITVFTPHMSGAESGGNAKRHDALNTSHSWEGGI
jgi:predicted nucleic acid-binding protein